MASSNYWSDGSGNELGIQTTKKWDWTGNCCYRCRHRFVVVFAVAVFIALPSFGVIVAAVTAVSAIVLVASATIALSAFDITVAVVATTFLAIEAALVFDCCVPLPLEEDHCLPPLLALGEVSVIALIIIALFATPVFVVVTALAVAVRRCL